MKFTIVTCPECNTKSIHTSQTVGFQCTKCGSFIHDHSDFSELKKEKAEEIQFFTKNYEEYKKQLKQWEEESIFITFPKYSVNDQELIKLAEEKNVTKK